MDSENKCWSQKVKVVILMNALYLKQNGMVITIPSTEVSDQSQWCGFHNVTFAPD